MSKKKPKYPLRPVEIIGKKHRQFRACILDGDNETIRLCETYEEAEAVAMVMNHVQAVWEPRFKVLEAKLKRRAALSK